MNRLFFILLLLCCTVGLQAAEPQRYQQKSLINRGEIKLPEPVLDESDWQWLRKKRTLIFGASAPNYPPYDVTAGVQDYDGINSDYLSIIAWNLNVQIEVYYYDNFTDMMNALKTGEIDLIGNTRREDSEKHGLLLTTPYFPAQPALVERTNNLMQQITPQNIAVEFLYRENPGLRALFPKGKYQVYNSPRRALEALSFNNLDAFIGDATSAQYLINQANLNNLRLKLLKQDEGNGFSFAVTKENARLQNILNAVLKGIPKNADANIQRRWSGGLPLTNDARHLLFTSLERKWIEENPVVRVVISDDSAPLGFFDRQGVFHGLTADILDAIASRSGLQFQMLRVATLKESLEAVNSGRADVVAGATLDTVWPNGLLTTRSYLVNSWVLVGPRSKRGTEHTRIALIEGYPLKNFIEQRYPESKVIFVPSLQEGVKALKRDNADSLVLPMVSADFILAHSLNSDLQILDSLETELARFVMGVSSNKYPLATILDKALLNIPPEDIHAMASNWYSNTYLMEFEPVSDRGEPARRESVWPIIVSIVVLLLVVVLVYLLLNKKQRGQELGKLQAMLDAIPVPLYLTDFHERIITANAYFYASLGLPPRSAPGQLLADYQLTWSQNKKNLALHTDERAPHALFINRQLAIHEQVRNICQWRVLLMDGEYRADGAVGGWFDVTEREQLVEQLQQAKELADNANRAKTTFLTTMSHEIRTPLNAIIGILELVLRQHQRGAAPDFGLLGAAHESAHSLLALIGDILDISRIEANRLILHPERANLRYLIEAVARLFDGMARQKQLEFRLELDADVTGDVLIDPLRFKQVLSNLLSNAIKFTSQGRVTLSVFAGRQSDERMDLDIHVADTGQGIDEQTRKQLFQPFAQGNNDKNNGGSGLGLYISRTLVDMMGGTLTLTSEPGIGSEVSFGLSLPRLMALPEQQSKTLAPLPSTALREVKILVVEDNAAGRMLLVQQLEFLGYQAVAAEDGIQALTKLAQQQFDLMITDCHMPNLDGFQLTRQWRRQEKGQSSALAIWGLTASAQGEARETCLEAGMDDCLFKPVSLKILSEKITLLMSEKLPEMISDDVFFDIPAELKHPAVQSEFINTLAICLSEDVAALRKETENASPDEETIRALAHKLSGSAKLVKANVLIHAAQAVEHQQPDADVALLIAEAEQLAAALWIAQRTTNNDDIPTTH